MSLGRRWAPPARRVGGQEPREDTAGEPRTQADQRTVRVERSTGHLGSRWGSGTASRGRGNAAGLGDVALRAREGAQQHRAAWECVLQEERSEASHVCRLFLKNYM